MPFDEILTLITGFITQFITVIIVAVPEGLPLTITLSLAYSVMRMKKDGILIKDLTSPEVMGRVDNILIGKTGTLTTGELKVTDFWAQGKTFQNKRANTLFNVDIKEDVLTLIQDSIVFNCDSRIEMNDQAFYEPVGNGTEVALLKFLQDAEIPVHDVIKEKVGFVEYQIPFSSSRKTSAIAIKYPDHDLVRVFVKGAPEYIIFNCSQTYDEFGLTTLEETQQQVLANDVVGQKYCKNGLRCLAFAYKDYNLQTFEELRQSNNQFHTDKDREQVFFQGLTLVSIFAMKDTLRPEVKKAIKLAKAGNIQVRLISGDHIETAINFALQAKIITPDEVSQGVCLSGEEFRIKAGNIKKDA